MIEVPSECDHLTEGRAVTVIQPYMAALGLWYNSPTFAWVVRAFLRECCLPRTYKNQQCQHTVNETSSQGSARTGKVMRSMTGALTKDNAAFMHAELVSSAQPEPHYCRALLYLLLHDSLHFLLVGQAQTEVHANDISALSPTPCCICLRSLP